MHRRMYFLIFLFFHCASIVASNQLTHLEKISRHLFFIKPDPAYCLPNDSQTPSGSESDNSDEEADKQKPANTQLRKAIEDYCEKRPSLKSKDLAELTKTVLLAQNLKRAHHSFLQKVTNPKRMRSKKCIEIMNEFPLNSRWVELDKKRYQAMRKELEARYPKKFAKVKIIVNTCGLKAAQQALEEQLIHIGKKAPIAAKIIDDVFREQKLYTIGALVAQLEPLTEE